MERWTNKVAVVTGASAGIGASIAAKLIANDIHVVGLARRFDKLQDLATALGPKFHPIQADVTKEDDVRKAFDWTTANLGPVHILINNAGICIATSILDGSTEQFRNVYDTNILSVTIVTREAVKIMRQYGVVGHIVHVSSLAGHRVPNVPLMNVYPASKHAVRALAESLRQELVRIGSKIKITVSLLKKLLINRY